MIKQKTQQKELSIEEDEMLVLKAKRGFSLLLTFGLILGIESVIFLMLQLQLANMLNQSVFAINLGSIIISIAGAITFTYYYHTRFGRRILIIGSKDFSLQVGKKVFEYTWSEFSLVALATASATYGAKGYMLRLFEDDLDSDFVDLPLYRFPKVDQFDMRKLVIERITNAKKS
ncbi:MAG: hypothetical protein ACXAC6_12090 [Candidatus Hodarchaeales archaeon]|jgi:hypothetical protein